MKLERGMYVRTNDGIIAKNYGEFSNNAIVNGVFIKQNHTKWIYKNRITKVSHNIIDLIEIGDYVNGKEVIALRKDISKRDIHPSSKNCNIFILYSVSQGWYFGIKDEDIKSIVTKEQFSQMEYRVGE